MLSQLIVLLAAGVGGVAPNLINLAQGFIKESPDVPGPFYFVGVAIFFALGAVVAFVFAETNARKAFFLGIALPALVTTAQTHGVPKAMASAVIPSAQAQPLPRVVRVADSNATTIRLKSASDCSGCEIWFADAGGKIIAKQVLQGPQARQAIAVPKEAASVGIADPKSNFKLLDVPRSGAPNLTIVFERTYSPIRDLQRGLGDYSVKSYDARVKWKTAD